MARRRYVPFDLDDLILRVQKPSRYIGGEVNSVVKSLPDCKANWALCFPDTYEVGMSNVGFRVIYSALNQRPDVACERTFLPWPDLEALMRAERIPLWTLESRVPVADFDVVGITMQFETCYPGVLALLDLAGIPLLSAERGPDDPLVLGGGPCAVNAEPVHLFFDALVVGEGEEVVHEITDAVADWKRPGGSRRELLWRLSEIPGVYVPSFFDVRYEKDGTLGAIVPLKPGYEKIVRRVVPDLNLVPQPERPIVPFMQTVFDRLPLEIQRGCTRGCRFCQVGMLTRPTRQRDPNRVRELAETGLANSGYEEVGFLSLSAGDYECLNPMLEDFFDRFGPERIAVSIPTLRTETMNEKLTEQIKRVRKTGFTVAPEAATERLRLAINKGNAEKDLLHAVETVFGSGWNLLKLYFMIGLPTETDEDVVAIVDVAKKSMALAKRQTSGAQINVAVSTFVPKPFTPFQWEPMISLAETERKHKLLFDRLGRRNGPIRLACHEADASEIEGALSLGDRRVATAVLSAWRQGARLDGWSEHFSRDRWLSAFGEVQREFGVGLDFFSHRERSENEVLPWDHIDVEVTKPYLWKERMKARSLAVVKDCVSAPCTACGACDYDVVDTRVYRAPDYVKAPLPPPPPEPETRTLVRFRFAKTGRAVALSHLETMTAVSRAIRRAKLPTAYTQGYHPKPKMGFGLACPVGVASEAEYFDLELVGAQNAADLGTRLDTQMPAGMRVLEAEAIDTGTPSLSSSLEAVHYRATFPEGESPEGLRARVATFDAAPRVTISREIPRQSKGRGRYTPARVKEIDLKSLLMRLSVSGEREVRFSVRAGSEGSARPGEVLAAIFGDGVTPPKGVRVLKEAVAFAVPHRNRHVAGPIPMRSESQP